MIHAEGGTERNRMSIYRDYSPTSSSSKDCECFLTWKENRTLNKYY